MIKNYKHFILLQYWLNLVFFARGCGAPSETTPGQIDNLYRSVVNISIAKGESSGQYVENYSFNSSAFC